MEVLVINYSFSRWWDCFLYPGTKRGLRNSGSPYSQEVYELAISTFGYKSLGTVDGVSSFPKFQRLKYPKSSNSILKDYILKGYALNDHRLEQLGQMIQIMKRATDQLDARQVLS